MDSTIITTEPENIKMILATDFKSYSLGDHRKKIMIPLLGEGIFTTDGAAWQHSRDMLRPSFVRTQVGDIDLFEKHVRNVIRAIPKNGSVVDLHDVFFKMSLDIASEFLFGESTGMLEEGDKNVEAERFVKSFQYAQNAMEGVEGDWGILSMIFWAWDPRLKREHKTVHGESKSC